MTFDRSQIPGWGADLDRANRPAVPDGTHAAAAGQRALGRARGSSRRPWKCCIPSNAPASRRCSAPACPPSGLSGMIRRAAFRYSEDRLRHWLMLLLADRVNVVEGLFDDARQSRKVHSIAAVGLVGLLAIMWMRRGA